MLYGNTTALILKTQNHKTMFCGWLRRAVWRTQNLYHGLSDQKCKVHQCAKLNPSTSKRDQMAKHRTSAVGCFSRRMKFVWLCCCQKLFQSIGLVPVIFCGGQELIGACCLFWSYYIAETREMVGLFHSYCIIQNSVASAFYVSLEGKCLIHNFSLKYPHGYD